MPPRSSGGAKDYDKMIMKLGRDIGNLRKQLNDLMGGSGVGGGGGIQRVPDGDHAMLSSKPLLGYRCMACDRPLEKLDERPGPYVPSNQMPVNVTPYERRGIGMPAGLESPPKPLHGQPTIDPVGKSGADGRGPQNWYDPTEIAEIANADHPCWSASAVSGCSWARGKPPPSRGRWATPTPWRLARQRTAGITRNASAARKPELIDGRATCRRWHAKQWTDASKR
eukprot:scaffold209567_cov45-Prasinocladus_malaysianus.AAC.1